MAATDALEQQATRLSALLLSREGWSKQYLKAPEQHAQLLQTTAQFQILLARFFRDMARHAPEFVNWSEYNRRRTQLDYSVDVTVNDQAIDAYDGTFIKVTLKTVTTLVTIGAAASETIYKIPLGITSTDEAIQNLGIDQVARLVGKKVIYNPDHSIQAIVDTPNPAYNVMDTVRKDIASSIKRSLALGRTTDEATADIEHTIINDHQRAKLIAQTESVNAYQAGVREFGRQSGAVGKVWLTAGATDVCADYAAEGLVPFDYRYGGTLEGPTAHPRCRCAVRLVYQGEWDRLHG